MKRIAIALLAAMTLSTAVSAQEVKVMTRNLYFGGSLDAALGAQSIGEIPPIVSAT
jgi:hypothetical protein